MKANEVFKQGSVNRDMVDAKSAGATGNTSTEVTENPVSDTERLKNREAPKNPEELKKRLEEDYNKYLNITKEIVEIFHKADFTNFEAFIVLEGVKQNLNTDIINFTVQQALAGQKMLQDIFQEGKVGAKVTDGPYK